MSALPNWQRTIVTQTGDVVPNAEIKVVVEATGLDAVLFTDRLGTVPLANPFFTGSDGFAQFYVAPGTYRVTATGPAGSRTWRYEEIFGVDSDNRWTGENEFFGDFEFSGNGEFSGDVDFTGNVTLNPSALASIETDLKRWNKENRLPVGSIIQAMGALTPSAWAGDPDAYEPIYDIQAGGTINETNYPDFVLWLRSQLVRVGSTTSFTGSASSSTITLDNNAANLAVLEALLEDQIFYSAYNRPITWGGSDFVITNINGVTRAITVTGTPTAGAGSATFHPYRIVGSTTTARILTHDGLVLATGGASGRVTGLVTRDRMQGHIFFSGTGNVPTTLDAGSIYGGTTEDVPGLAGGRVYAHAASTPTTQSKTSNPKTDGTNGTPRTGPTTRDRSLAVRLYAHCGRYQ